MAEQQYKLKARFPLIHWETENIKEWSIDSAYLTSTDSFSFKLYEQGENRKNLEFVLCLQPVELYVNGVLQLVGRVDKTRVGDNGTAITCMGRDFMADLVECNVDPALKLKLGDTLTNAVLLAASPVGISVVISEDDVDMGSLRSGKKIRRSGSGGGRTRGRGKRRGGKPVQDFKPQPGEGIYEFLYKLVARAGGTVQPGPDRHTLVIEEPMYEAEPHYQITRTVDQRSGARNNILDATADRDYSRFPTYTLVNGTQARGGEKGANAHYAYDLWLNVAGFRYELMRTLTGCTASDRWRPGKVADTVTEGRLYRLFVHRDEVARDATQVEQAARRAIAERLKDTLDYSATIRGLVDPDSGAIWSVNTIVNVDDDICNVHEPLWISERKLSYSERNGATTELHAWRPESFQLTADSGAENAGGKSSGGTSSSSTVGPQTEGNTDFLNWRPTR